MDYESLDNEMQKLFNDPEAKGNNSNTDNPEAKGDKPEESGGAQKSQNTTQNQQDDIAERSRLGRKVKYLEETLTTLTSQLQNQTQLLQSLAERLPSKDKKQEEQEEEIITTKQDVLRVLSEEERKKQEDRTRYQNNYVKAFQSLLLQEEDGIRSDIYKTWSDKYNVVFTGDPVRDAEIGYLKAKVDTLSSHAYKGREDTQFHPTKSSLSEHAKRYNLNSEAMELAQYFNLDDDDIKAALESDVIAPTRTTINRKK